jgi:flagellar protein FlgJ
MRKFLAAGALLVPAAVLAAISIAGSGAGASTPDAFLKTAGPAAQTVHQQYDVPASVTAAQAALESNWGGSKLTVNDKNYFGFKCTAANAPGPIATGCHAYPTTECTPSCHTVTAYFRVYASETDSFRDYGRLLTTSPVYAGALKSRHDADAYIKAIAPHYATDPNYASKVIATMKAHNLYALDKGKTSTPPTGSVYSLTHSGPGEWSVHGWAADPDHKTTAIQVRVLVNNRTKIVRANLNQPDVAQHKPGYGPNHGFNFTFGVPSTPERSHAEIDALDPVTHTWTRISHNWTLSGGQPVGHFESATRTGNKVTVTGWAIDPNLHGPSAVLVKIGNNSDRFLANTNRPDVGHAFPRWGNTHGYHDTFGIPTAATQVCITNLNSGPGTTGTTTCRKL